MLPGPPQLLVPDDLKTLTYSHESPEVLPKLLFGYCGQALPAVGLLLAGKVRVEIRMVRRRKLRLGQREASLL